MKFYESLYIVNPNYEQDRLDEIMKTVSDKLIEFGGSIINHYVWGKKRLAYVIQKHKYGSFVLLQYETGSTENLDRFERFMILEKTILRNQTVVLSLRPEVYIEEKPILNDKIETDQVSLVDKEEDKVEPFETSVEETQELESEKIQLDQTESTESETDKPVEAKMEEVTEVENEEVQE